MNAPCEKPQRPSSNPYKERIKEIRGEDASAQNTVRERQRRQAKPAGSLGVLEEIAVQYAGITGRTNNFIRKKGLILFAADNGIYEEGVASAPQEFTRKMLLSYAETRRCGINVICDANNVELKLVNMGVKGELNHPRIDNRKLMDGTRNFARGKPAMPRTIVERAIQIGFDYAAWAKKESFDILGAGEVGMANTTTATACIFAGLDIRENRFVGTGAGLSPDGLVRKKRVIQNALVLLQPIPGDGLDILSKVGGLDIAAMTGLYLGAAYYRIPVVVDGLIAIAAALLASFLQPLVHTCLFASHRSTEPAYQLAADALGLSPMLELNMRLGEGTGCPLAMQVIETALSVSSRMCTFEELAL